MNVRATLTALTLGLMAGTAFAATPAPAAKATPAPAAHKKQAASAPAVKCKAGEAVVNGKCEAAKAK